MSSRATSVTEDNATSLLRDAQSVTHLVKDVRFPLSFKWKVGHYDNIEFLGLETRFSEIKGTVLSWFEFSNCKFKEFLASGLICKKARFKYCEFFECKFGVDDTVFQNCEFSDMTLKCSHLRSVKFVDCSFTRVQFLDNNYIQTRWNACTFRDSIIKGYMETCVMDHVDFSNTDLSGAELSDFAFLDSKLRGALLPDNCKNFMAAPKAFATAKPSISTLISSVSYQIYCEIADAIISSPPS